MRSLGRVWERQAKKDGYETVEEYITASVYFRLEIDEDDAIVDARTGDAVLGRCLLPHLLSCKIDKDAPPLEKEYPSTAQLLNGSRPARSLKTVREGAERIGQIALLQLVDYCAITKHGQPNPKQF